MTHGRSLDGQFYGYEAPVDVSFETYEAGAGAGDVIDTNVSQQDPGVPERTYAGEDELESYAPAHVTKELDYLLAHAHEYYTRVKPGDPNPLSDRWAPRVVILPANQSVIVESSNPRRKRCLVLADPTNTDKVFLSPNPLTLNGAAIAQNTGIPAFAISPSNQSIDMQHCGAIYATSFAPQIVYVLSEFYR